MQFDRPLIQGVVRSRYKRFLADIDLLADESPETVIAHCANTGAMTGCYTLNGQVWVTHHDDPNRKLKYTWQVSRVHDDLVVVNTHLANKVVAEQLSVLWPDIDQWRAEYRVPNVEGRPDFAGFINGELARVVEVKSVTWLTDDGVGVFPDAVSVRAKKHAEGLQKLTESGVPTAMVLCAMHTGIRAIRPAFETDPAYAHALVEAVNAGVELVGLGVQVDLEQGSIQVDKRLDVVLEPENSHITSE